MKKILLMSVFLFLSLLLIADEASSSFALDGEDDVENSSAFHCTVGGELSIGGAFFFDELQNPVKISPGSPIGTNLHLHSAAPFTEAYIGVCLDNRTLALDKTVSGAILPTASRIPMWIDEAYLKLLFDSVVFSGGIQKIAWGRAEFLSILDKVNPLDKTRLPTWNRQAVKIAQPLFSAVVYLPENIKCEALFLPVFEGHRIFLNSYLQDPHIRSVSRRYANGQQISVEPAATNTLAYAQGGGRCSFTVFDTHDVGVQYFYGFLPDAAFIKQGSRFIPHYNPYHHVGIDYGTVLGSVNVWAEAGIAVTNDIRGSETAVYNPFFEWNSGFSYNAPYGFLLNITAAQRIILHHKHIVSPFDVEYGRNPTETTLRAGLSQSVLRGAMEWRLCGFFNIEDASFYMMPEIQWLFASFMVDCTVGIFGGKKTDENPEPFRNSFVRLSIVYSF